MSEAMNPYHSPAANTEIISPLVSQGNLTETMMKYLVEASPWLRFLGIMGFISAGLMVLGGIFVIIALPFMGSLDYLSDISSSFSAIFGSIGPIMIIYALYFIGGGTVVFFPALYTFRFGAKIRAYSLNSSEKELEEALKSNKSLWKFYGILTIIGIAIVPIMIIVGIVAVAATMAIY